MSRRTTLVALVLLVQISAACGSSSVAAVRTPSPSAASPSASPSPVGKVSDWVEYHGTADRSGQGPSTPALSNPRQAWSVPVDATVYASPLIFNGRVIVATENNSLYSINLDRGTVFWSVHLGAPVSGYALPCGNIEPITGITGTPVIDPQSGRIYVVAFLAGFVHKLFTLDAIDGSVLSQQVIDPPGSIPAVEQERGALSLSSGYVYVPLGGLYGDCGRYHGYVVGVPLASGASIIYRTPSARESGIWSAMGPTVADSGSIYVTTGNGSETSSFAYSNSVLQLSPDLKVQAYFAPTNWASLDATDTDLGSVGATLMPYIGRLVAIGKEGVVYLLDASRPGGIGGQIAARRVCSGAWGGTAWLGSTIFLPCADALVAISVTQSSLAVAWRFGQARLASAIVAAGAVWAIDVNTTTLFALNPASGAVLYQLRLNGGQHFSTPAATEGYVVAPAGNKIVAVATA
ncbi:MAG TPA: PQQ-binding-like beta-propeller repeat protein [Candidatus Dormibacteraeota bacterium]|nr:PQQ-binding-like beta-propeller repeat protein [Candidatus Dormibacteraeota bacterium]